MSVDEETINEMYRKVMTVTTSEPTWPPVNLYPVFSEEEMSVMDTLHELRKELEDLRGRLALAESGWDCSQNSLKQSRQSEADLKAEVERLKSRRNEDHEVVMRLGREDINLRTLVGELVECIEKHMADSPGIGLQTLQLLARARAVLKP